MDFGKIKRIVGEIAHEEWSNFIFNHDYLEQAQDRKGINPFTHEEIIFPGQSMAYYCEMGQRVGNICLQEGILLTTGVPESVCIEIAKSFNAVLSEDDRN